MTDALAPLATRPPSTPTPRSLRGDRRKAADWQRRCQQLQQAARTLLLAAGLPDGQRAALFGNEYELTDVERQIIQAYRTLSTEDRQAFRVILSKFSRVDVARKEKRDRLASERRQTIRQTAALTKGGA